MPRDVSFSAIRCKFLQTGLEAAKLICSIFSYHVGVIRVSLYTLTLKHTGIEKHCSVILTRMRVSLLRTCHIDTCSCMGAGILNLQQTTIYLTHVIIAGVSLRSWKCIYVTIFDDVGPYWYALASFKIYTQKNLFDIFKNRTETRL